jgi:hypothetical protein
MLWLPLPRFLNPSFMPIFFQGLSTRFLGLLARIPGSLDGGVVGGVIGSPVLD